MRSFPRRSKQLLPNCKNSCTICSCCNVYACDHLSLLHCHSAHGSNACCRPDHVQVFVMKHTPIFFAERDGPWYPTLRLLHQYPEMMKKLRVDKGALKFVMSGANIMCPGLTSPGATIHDEVCLKVFETCVCRQGDAVSKNLQTCMSHQHHLRPCQPICTAINAQA